MARKLNDGTVSRRIRLKLPGWRDGAFDLRPGRASKRLYDRWREFVLLAHREGYHDVLDALQDGELSMAKAIKLSTTGGLAAVRAHLEAEAKRRGVEGNFVVWLREFLEVQPRRASEEHHDRIGAYVTLFLDFLVERHGLKKRGDVTGELWSRANLEAYFAHYVRTAYASAEARLHDEWDAMGRPLEQVERDDELRKERGKKRVTANRHVNGVAAFSKWLISRGRLEIDPAVGVRLSTTEEAKHREGSHRSLKPPQVKSFLRWSREYDRVRSAHSAQRRPDTLFWEMLLATGARTYTEGPRIRPEDIHPEESQDGATPLTIRASKGLGKTRTVYVVDSFARRLLERAKRDGISPGRSLFPFTESVARSVWNGVMRLIADRDRELHEEIGEATPYWFRHTFAVSALKTGVDIYTLKELMGHENITTTEIYLSHVDAPFKRMAAMGRALGLDTDEA
jgi:site-specific recombinase XerD